jgi:DNA-binding NarL/FixJ family response regulator
MIKVLIADDHPIVRKGICELIATASDMQVAGEAASAQETIDNVLKSECDVLLLDLGMPGRSGLDIIKPIKDEKPNVAILILTMYPEKQYAVRALKAGAAGYVTKKSGPEEIREAIRKVSMGLTYVTPSLAAELVDYVKEESSQSHKSLSNREYEVMIRIARGDSLKDIAEEFSLSVTTISTYRLRVLEKMGMTKNAELTKYALSLQLI